jgi:predicted ribosome quality control (RQC) complex YloA/Tae2 family protein
MAAKSLSSLDLYKLVNELSFLNGGFVRNVKSRKNEIYFLIFSDKEVWLKLVPGSHISISQEKPEDLVDFPFTLLLRSVFKGKRIVVSMHTPDRIFEIKSNDYLLSLELFSKGNLILVKDGKIVQALYNRSYSGREVSAGEKFEYPPGRVDVFSIGFDEFSSLLRKSDRENLVKALAIDFSMGGEYAEEVCYRAGLDKNMQQSACSRENTEKIFSIITSMIKDEAKPNIIDKNILSAVELKHLQGDREYFSGINSAVKAFFSAPAQKDFRQEKIEKDIDTAKASIDKYAAIIEFITTYFERIEKAISTAKDSNIDIDKRKSELKAEGWLLDGRFIVNESNQDIRIDITKPLRETLDEYYTKKKRLSKALSTPKIVAKKARSVAVAHSEVWYSKFRWFFTSGNRLVVIGRDINQNGSLIEKHLEKDDIVLHADVFGSPFGLLKSAKGAVQSDIEEAAAGVASYSSAWKAGASNLDVYYVYPEQVTKTPPSGESLKKGAFYIEGRKNYIKNVSLGIYLSFSLDDSALSITLSIHEPKRNFVLVRPGNKKREEVIKKILKKLEDKMGIKIKSDEIDKLLPQGKCSIEKIEL